MKRKTGMLAGQFYDLARTGVLFFGACVGHTALWMFAINIAFGLPWPKHALSLARKLHALVVFSAPVLFWFGMGLDRTLLGGLYAVDFACPFMRTYTLLCWFFGFVLLPGFTLWNMLRRPAGNQESGQKETIDVATELGYRPEGDGKRRGLCRIPGNQIFQVDFVEQTFRLPRLPSAWNGLSILHLSDLHFSGTPDRAFYRYVFERCREWEPDLVALTGDIVDHHRLYRWIVPLLGRLRWRVAAFAILGNHDKWHDPPLIRRRLRRLGMRVLGNTWERLEVRGQPLVVVGHEGPWFRPSPDLTSCPEGPFRLCLSHTPDNIRWARRHNVDLMLSGHNHGGQIRLPVLGSIFVPSIYGRRYDAGTFEQPPTLLYVSRGLAGQFPLRFNCRPEVTRIVLQTLNDAN